MDLQSIRSRSVSYGSKQISLLIQTRVEKYMERTWGPHYRTEEAAHNFGQIFRSLLQAPQGKALC